MVSTLHQIELLHKLKRGECSQDEQALLFNDPYMPHFEQIVRNAGIDTAIAGLSKFALNLKEAV